MTAIQLHDIVQFRENETTLGAGHISRVWDRPARDPYVTISSEGRTFVRFASAVTVTRKAQPDSCPSCASEARAERGYVPGFTGMPVTCGDEWHDEDER